MEPGVCICNQCSGGMLPEGYNLRWDSLAQCYTWSTRLSLWGGPKPGRSEKSKHNTVYRIQNWGANTEVSCLVYWYRHSEHDESALLSCIRKAESGLLWVWGQPGLHISLASLGYCIRHWLKTYNKIKINKTDKPSVWLQSKHSRNRGRGTVVIRDQQG